MANSIEAALRRDEEEGKYGKIISSVLLTLRNHVADDAHLIVHKCLLIGYLFVRLHLAVEGEGTESVVGEPHSQFFGSAGPRDINDGGTL